MSPERMAANRSVRSPSSGRRRERVRGSQGGVAQARAVHAGEHPEGGEVERRRDAERVAAGDLERLHEVLDEAVGGCLLDLQAHHVAEAPAPQLGLDGPEQVVGLVRDREVRVARDAEAGGVDDLHARKEPLHVGRDDVLERHQAVARRQQARQPRRHLDAGEARLPLHRVAHAQAQVEREAGDVGERQSRADGQRREDRVDLAVELLVDLRALRGRQVADAHHLDALGGQRRADLLVPQAALLGRELAHALGHPVEHLVARELVGRRRDAPGLEGVLHGGHADHEELVEVAREDGEELAALQQRDAGVGRQGQHARVEVEPRELAVDVERGIREVGGGGGVVRRAHRTPILDPRGPAG